MTASDPAAAIRVEIRPDDRRAELVIPAGIDAALVTVEACLNELERASIALDEQARARLLSLVESRRPGSELRAQFGAARLLVVPGVDLARGPLEHDGPLRIDGGAPAGSVVRSGGALFIQGPVEDARIEAQGDVTLQAGATGRGAGSICAEGSLSAPFLEAIDAEVLRVLRLERHATNCRLVVHGAIDAPNATIVGGATTVTGQVRIGTLGGDGAPETKLTLGVVCGLEPIAGELSPLLARLISNRDSAQSELDSLNIVGRRISPADRAHREALEGVVRSMQERIDRARAGLELCLKRIRLLQSVELSIQSALRVGASITIGDEVFRARSDLAGPLHVFRSERREVLFKRSEADDPAPFAQVTESSARAA